MIWCEKVIAAQVFWSVIKASIMSAAHRSTSQHIVLYKMAANFKRKQHPVRSGHLPPFQSPLFLNSHFI